MGEAPPLLTSRRVADLLRTHGLEPHRTLGQNFLVDPNTVRRIVRLADVGPEDQVIEIGPGLGSLSVGLMATGARLRLVELDARLVAPLREVVGPEVDIVVGDARTLDWDTVAAPGRWTVVANLPYNVAATVILQILDAAPQVTRLVVMVQREVAERLAAGPGTRVFGIPSIKVRYWGSARLVASVGREVFIPRPRVDSAIVEIVRSPGPARDDAEAVFALVKQAFGQRRKMLSTSLRGVVSREEFVTAGVDPTARPECLDVDDWVRLVRAAR
jgi:16S rRNA (adenine1518-N6/adenine1519-N6)-dimethyltransferase